MSSFPLAAQVERVLLERGGTRRGDELHAECIWCGATAHHFGFNTSKGTAHCHRCGARGGVLDTARQLGIEVPERRNGNGQDRPSKPTVRDLASYVKLPAEYLVREFGLYDLPGGGVAIPYRNVNGERVHIKQRRALRAKDGSFWPRGAPAMIYGAERLEAIRAEEHVLLVEGESDCWTGWANGIPTLGIPGSGNAAVLQAEHVKAIPEVYTWREPDEGGTAFVRNVSARLAELGYPGRVYVLGHPAAKDISELFKLDAARFEEEFLLRVHSAEEVDLATLASVAPTNGNGHALNLTSHYREVPCEVRFREVDAASLVGLGTPEVPPSLPFLGRDGYILQGFSHLLSGYPKVGKTEVLFACVEDWVQLGTSVLWLSEESEHVWRMRLARRSSFPSGLKLVFALGVPPDVLLERARTGAEQVVILDTVRNLLCIEDENSNSAIAAALGPWEAALSGKTRTYAHHERKGGGEHGQAIAGGGAFLGIVDRALEITFDEHDSRRRKVKVHSRVIDAPDFLYAMDEQGEFLCLGDPSAVAFEGVKDAVLEIVTGDWAKTKDIWEALGDAKPSLRLVQEALNAHLEGGRVERDPAEKKPGATYRWRSAQLPTSPRTEPLYSARLGSDSVADDGQVDIWQGEVPEEAE